MSVESGADRASMLDKDEFGVEALLNGATTIVGIFDAEFVGVDIISGVDVESSGPQFLASTSDVLAVVEDDTLLISGVTYRVKSAQPDGTGITLLKLEKS